MPLDDNELKFQRELKCVFVVQLEHDFLPLIRHLVNEFCTIFKCGHGATQGPNEKMGRRARTLLPASGPMGANLQHTQ